MRELLCQQKSFEWHKARAGIVTSTSLKSAIGTPTVQKTLMYELVAERMTEPQIREINVEAVVRGNELEPIARAYATKELQIKFETIGMMISDEVDGFGTSPDCVCRRGNKIVGGLEIKCPNSKKHVEYIIKNEVPKEYWHQILSQFIVNPDVKWWTFMSFDDRNYLRPDFYITVKRRDISKEINEAYKRLKDFLKTVDEVHEKLTF